MRGPLTFALVGLGLMVGPIAHATQCEPNPSPGTSTPPTCLESLGGTAGDCFGSIGGTVPCRPGGTGGSSSGPQTRYVPYAKLVNGPDGELCVTSGYYPEGSPVPDDAAPAEVPSQDRIPGAGGYNPIYDSYPLCPPSEETPAQGQPDTPAQYAARYWERVLLPVPKPYIAPGWAITGKLAYLETRGATTKTFHADTPFGPLEINATGQYYVDWGDNESTGPHSREGKPWPEGEITHDYVWARTYDITVTERWVATWSLGGQSGTLRQLRTAATIDDFPARQIQAVIR